MNKWMIVIAFASLPVQAQTDEFDNDEWGIRGQYQQMFDRKTVQTVQGQILTIEPFSPGNRMCNGLHIKLRTAAKPLVVHLGPQWYIEDQKIALHYGMQVRATGSMIQFQQAPAMIAIEISTEHGILKLRSADGIPYWSSRMSLQDPLPDYPPQEATMRREQSHPTANVTCGKP